MQVVTRRLEQAELFPPWCCTVGHKTRRVERDFEQGILTQVT